MAKTRSTTGITQPAEVLQTISTTGYREYTSTMASKNSPVGNGPQKSLTDLAKGLGEVQTY